MISGSTQLIKRMVILIVAGVVLSGCVVYSKQPLTSLSNLTPDPRLDGIWAGKDKPVLLIKGRKDGWVTIAMLEEPNNPDGLDILHMNAIPSLLNGKRFLSVKMIAGTDFSGAKKRQTDTPGDFLIVRYKFSSDGKKFYLELLNDNAIETAIKAGRLKGKKQSGDWVIDESSERVAAFISALSNDNFKTENPLTRLKKF